MRVTASYLEKVGRDWQAAYAAANGKTAPAIRWSKGWFRVGDDPLGKGYRRAELEEMTKRLRLTAASSSGATT
jgi:predicted TPR repeat methyltransferase